MMRAIAVALLLFIILAFSCKKQHHNITRGFYYWKTIYKPSAYELNTLHKLHVQKMYTRLFDVDIDPATQRPIPIAPIQFPARLSDSFDIVPVVFITQKTLTTLEGNEVETLAAKTAAFIRSLCDGAGIHPTEIQIDCDWTAGTKDVYFGLLRALKRQDYFKGKTLSCTLRMHQVKYTASSGIPPVDKAMLMCYSMGDLKKTGNRNSILDVAEAKDYLKKINLYPLPLDIALPIFQWCILFRENKFRGILHDVAPDMVSNSGVFVHENGNLYTCKADTVWQGYPLRAKDVVRLESVTGNDLMDVGRFTSKQITCVDMNVLLFSCDSITLSKYSTDELEAVYNANR